MGVTLVSTNAVYFSPQKVVCQVNNNFVHPYDPHNSTTFRSDNIIRYIFPSTNPGKLTKLSTRRSVKPWLYFSTRIVSTSFGMTESGRLKVMIRVVKGRTSGVK